MTTRGYRIAESLVSENEEYMGQAMRCVSVLAPAVAKAYRQVFGEESPRATMDIRIGVGDDGIPDGKAGSLGLPSGERDYAVLLVRQGSFSGESTHYWWVVAHELIHAFLGKGSEHHGEVFGVMADALGMPEKYRK